jgi:hypothetical protein
VEGEGAGSFCEDVGVRRVEEEDHSTTHLKTDSCELTECSKGLVRRLDRAVSGNSIIRVEVCPVHFSSSKSAYRFIVAVEFVFSLDLKARTLFG